MVVVADRDAHGALLLAVLAEGRAGLERDIDEGAGAGFLVEGVRAGVVGDEEVGMSVAVEVAPHGPHAEAAGWIGNAGPGRDVFEGAISPVAIERVARAGQSSGAALHRDAPEFAELPLTELGQRVEADVR